MLAFSQLFYCMAGKLIVELEEVRDLFWPNLNERQVQERYIFARVADVGVGEGLLDRLQYGVGGEVKRNNAG